MSAARIVFRKKGYVNAEITEIIGEAGRAVGVFYTYFDNKADLLRALIKQYHEEGKLWDDVSDEAFAQNRELLMKSALDRFQAHSSVFAAVMQASMTDASFKGHLRELRAEGVKVIARLVREMQVKGFCGPVDPDLTASALLTMFHYSCMNWFYDKTDFEGRTVSDAEALSTFRHIVNATLTHKAATSVGE